MCQGAPKTLVTNIVQVFIIILLIDIIFYCSAGAHNTIVTARAGKDLVSCLVSGLLTIGPRFGGAVDDSARYFQDACDRGDMSAALQ